MRGEDTFSIAVEYVGATPQKADTHPADLTDHLGFGVEKRRQGNLDILAEKKTFRSVPSTFHCG